MLYFGTRACLFKSTRSQDPTVMRMLSKLQNKGKAALPDKLQEVLSGIPRPPGTCSPPQGLMGWPVGNQGRSEVGRAGSKHPLGRKEAQAGGKMPQPSSGAGPWLKFAGHSLVWGDYEGPASSAQAFVFI